MNRQQFISYAQEAIPALEETLAEHETQYQSECALYGDAGPGQGLHITQLRKQLTKLKRQLERLRGQS